MPRILSTIYGWSGIPSWDKHVDSIRLLGWSESGREGWFRALLDIWNGIYLCWRSRRYDGVITDSRLHASVFGMIQRIPFIPKRRHLILECYWSDPGGLLKKVAKVVQLRGAFSPYTRAVVYARRERQAFSSCFGIPADRFVFIPYHTTLYGYSLKTERANNSMKYLFAGGDAERDYETLFRAVEDVDIPVVVAVRDRRKIESLHVPKNVEITSLDDLEFLNKTREAYINVIPLKKGSLRAAGHQTFLNAMALGGIVIVTDPRGGGDYIKNWADGVLVEAGDVEGLRDAILRIWENEELAREIRSNARKAAEKYGTERILSLIAEFVLSDQFLNRECAEFTGDSIRGSGA